MNSDLGRVIYYNIGRVIYCKGKDDKDGFFNRYDDDETGDEDKLTLSLSSAPSHLFSVYPNLPPVSFYAEQGTARSQWLKI